MPHNDVPDQDIDDLDVSDDVADQVTGGFADLDNDGDGVTMSTAKVVSVTPKTQHRRP